MLDKNIVKDILPYKKTLILVILSNIIQATMIVSISYIIAYLADKLLFDELGHSAATPFLVLLFFFFIVKAVLNYINRLKMEEISLKVQSRLRYELLKAMAQDFKAAEKKPEGQWLALVTKGVDKLDTYLTGFLPQLGILLTFPAVLLICAFISDWISGLIFFVTAPLIPFFMVLIGKIADKENKKQWHLFQKLTVFMTDLLPGLLVVKAYNQTQRQIEQMRENGAKFSMATLKVLKIAFLSAFMLEFIATISIAVIAVNIGLRLLYGQAEFLPVFFCLLIAPQFYQPFRQFGAAFHDAMNGITAAGEIYALVHGQETAGTEKETDFIMQKPPQISFYDISYTYEKNRAVLNNLSFTVAAGSQVVLTPGQQAGVEKASGFLDVREVNVEACTMWRRGLLVFYEESLRSICRKLERWYDVRIDTSSPSLDGVLYTGMVKRHETLNTIADLMNLTNDVVFSQQDDGTIRVVRKPRPKARPAL